MNELPRSQIRSASVSWHDRRWLLVLLILTAGLRGWQLTHTELTTRDSIAFIRYAWRLDHEPWGEVLRNEAHHPGYPFSIWLVSKPVRAILDADLPRQMQVSAQLASVLASLLLIFPLFYLGKQLFDARVAFWGTLLLQVLPVTGRLMADGVSEPLFLLWSSLALCCGVRALSRKGLVWFGLTGLFTGLAYLTRTEGLLLGPVVLLGLAGCQCLRTFRLPWFPAFRSAATLTVACTVLAVPFMLQIGGLSRKASLQDMKRSGGWQQPPDRRAHFVATPVPLAMWNIGPNITPRDRIGWAAQAVAIEFDRAFFHFLTIPAVLGPWYFRRRLAHTPAMWPPVMVAIGLLPLLYRLAQSSGYVSDRHMLLVVLSLVWFGVAGLLAFAAWLMRRWPGWQVGAPACVLACLVVACLPKTLGRLHAHRAGFREVGDWLATNTLLGDDVYDPLAWTAYHAGRLFVTPDALRSKPAICYVVLERSKNPHPHLYYLLDLAEELAQRGEVVHRRRVVRGREEAEIIVYRVPRPGPQERAGQRLQVWLEANHNR